MADQNPADVADQLAVIEAAAQAGLAEPNDMFAEGFVKDYFGNWEDFQTFFEMLLDQPITRETRLPEIVVFGENHVRVIRCLWWLDRIGRNEAKGNYAHAGLFIRTLLLTQPGRSYTTNQERAFLLFTQLSLDYARVLYASPRRDITKPFEAQLADNLEYKHVPAEYARELPWMDQHDVQGYSDEDIDALFIAGIPYEYANEFHDALLDRFGRVSNQARLILDEMESLIEFHRIGIPAGYAGYCTRLHMPPEETIAVHRAGIALEYLDSVA